MMSVHTLCLRCLHFGVKQLMYIHALCLQLHFAVKRLIYVHALCLQLHFGAKRCMDMHCVYS